MPARVVLLLVLLASLGGVEARRLPPPQTPPLCAPAAPAPNAAPRAGRVPIEVVNNHVYVKVCAYGRSWDFLLDTGAGATYFDLGSATAAGATLGAEFRARGGGAGTAAGAALGNQTVTLAGTEIAVPVPGAIDFSMLTPREGRRIEGVLGFDFIRRFVVVIDYVGRELRLLDRERFSYDGPGESVPVTFAANHPHIDAAIRLADGAVINGRFVVDVGASFSLGMARPFVTQHRLRERAGRTVRRRSGGGVGGPVTAEIGRFAALQIGRVELAAPIALLFGEGAGVFSDNARWDGNIGGDVLRRFTLYLDYARGRMIFEPHAGTSEPFETDMSGTTMRGLADSPDLIVEEVLAATPAAESGLEPGDRITAIDGARPGADALILLRQRLRRAGESVQLQVTRGERSLTVRLVTRRLV